MVIINNIKDYNYFNSYNLPILASQKYLQNKSKTYGWLVSDNFILPYFLDKRLIFTRMVFTYRLIHQKENLNIKDEEIFLDGVVDFIKQKKLCDFIYKAQSNVIFNNCPKSSDCVKWGTYLVDLSLSEEELLSSFHVKHRNVIKKASKDGVVIQETTNLDKIQEIIADTMTRQKVIHFPSKQYLKQLKTTISNNLLFLKAVKDGELQGVAVFIYDNKQSYYMYGGSIPRPYTGSMNLLHFEAMKIFKEKNINFYDFVGARLTFSQGSKYEGLDRFKRRFGGSLQKGMAFRVVVNPIKFKLFNAISKIYLKVKGYNYTDPIDSIMSSKT
jgi:hypothetical protein